MRLAKRDHGKNIAPHQASKKRCRQRKTRSCQGLVRSGNEAGTGVGVHGVKEIRDVKLAGNRIEGFKTSVIRGPVE